MEPFVFHQMIRREMSVVLDLAKSSQVWSGPDPRLERAAAKARPRICN